MDRSNGNNGNHDRVAVVTVQVGVLVKLSLREFVQNGYCVILNSRDEEDQNSQGMIKGDHSHKKILGSPKLGLGKPQILSNIGASRI
jgi:hypothetical protein